MNSRLLHATARGARILCRSYDTDWGEVDMVCLKPQDPRILEYTIHPSDAHLEYGLISTALRNNSQNLDSVFVNNIGLCIDGNYEDLTEFEVGLFFNIMAEALADEGL